MPDDEGPLRIRNIAGCIGQHAYTGKKRLSPGVQLVAGIGELQTALCARKELDAEVAFQLAYRRRQRLLGDEEVGSGGGKRRRFCGDDELKQSPRVQQVG
ncbi:Uncharacterised protein [Mycobacteroides abscessus subsp. abscessus]|nr:Uncharacterised protein [Mycobacteroides abscessus subsp. abscessus]